MSKSKEELELEIDELKSIVHHLELQLTSLYKEKDDNLDQTYVTDYQESTANLLNKEA